MTPEEFLKRFYPTGFPISPEQWGKDVPEIMESYAECCEESQWISVEERLPEIGQFCIVYQPIGAYDGRPIFSCGFHSIDAGIWPNITHWQPLPKPPKQ